MANELTTFDYDGFAANLLTAAYDGFVTLQRHHPQEEFYVYGFYASPTYSHLFASANSEAALTRTARAYIKQDRGRGWYAGLNETDVRVLLRNIATDWEYHCFSADMGSFDAVSAAFGAGARWYERVLHRERRLDEDEAWDIMRAYLARMRGICAAVLSTLDQQGVFGDGATRKASVLTLMVGEATLEERLHWAAQLNPPDVVARYAVELEAASTIGAIVAANMQNGLFTDKK
ncbi:MAG: DUF4303 domain-containing protein [Anaerolineae bacterium]|nr:DUF4303 domain-containing protein [Anaerolineae bacterium]